MTIAKISCRTCEHFNSNKINGRMVYVCTLFSFSMNGKQANTSRGSSNEFFCKSWSPVFKPSIVDRNRQGVL